MKKAQILSALALAFALGVAVIPSASTYAAIVKDVNGQDVTDTETVAKVEKAINDGKESCGWHLVGTTKTWYFDDFNNLKVQLDNSAEAIETTEENQVSTIKEDYKDAIKTLSDALAALTPAVNLPSSIKAEVPSEVKTYSEVVNYVNSAVSTLKNFSTGYTAVTAVATNTNTAVNALNATLKTASDAVKVATDGQANAIETLIAGITGKDVDTNITYAAAVNKANSLTTTADGKTCSIAKVTNLKKAIEYAQNMINSTQNFYAADAEKAIAQITTAMNGGTVDGGNQGEGSNKPDQNAPDTGILANAEGSASTTVAMVAGIATALTAAGAGVVAYRNARRSSRK